MSAHRLARVRRVRELQERVLRAEWANAERAVQRLVDVRRDASARFAQKTAVGQLDPREILSDEAALDRLEAAIIASRAHVRAARRHAETQRVPWQARRTDAEALQRLESKQRARESAERARVEQAQMDDQTSARRARMRVEADEAATEAAAQETEESET